MVFSFIDNLGLYFPIGNVGVAVSTDLRQRRNNSFKVSNSQNVLYFKNIQNPNFIREGNYSGIVNGRKQTIQIKIKKLNNTHEVNISGSNNDFNINFEA